MAHDTSEQYENIQAEVKTHLKDLGYADISSLTALDDDRDSYGAIIYRWSLITNGIDYSVECYTIDGSIDISIDVYDCLNP